MSAQLLLSFENGHFYDLSGEMAAAATPGGLGCARNLEQKVSGPKLIFFDISPKFPIALTFDCVGVGSSP